MHPVPTSSPKILPDNQVYGAGYSGMDITGVMEIIYAVCWLSIQEASGGCLTWIT
jgi:hypothetical protein